MRRVVMFAYPDAQMLDVTGPLEVFARADRFLREDRRGARAYHVEIVASRRGPVRTSSGMRIVAERSIGQVRGGVDTLLLAGGVGTEAAVRDAALITWIRRMAPRVRRIGAVCSGAFLLAEAGLLDGRRAVTHWSVCELLGRRYPKIAVEPDPIFIKDGAIYTSAGVTAGMDLALALVEEDHGREASLEVARQLVMFLRRPGGQSQFSAQLSSQLAKSEPLRDLQTWILEHLDESLSVESLAARVHMSPRNFARVFVREVGVTPARYVVEARIEAARRLLEETKDEVEPIAAQCGFGTAESMRRAFVHKLRTPPSSYRERFRRQP